MPIRREFLGWDAPPLQAAVDFLCGDFCGDERRDDVRRAGVERATLDLRDLLVVLPARRAARRLEQRLVERCERENVVLIPPRWVTVGSLPEQLYPPQKPFADDLIQQLVWAHALTEVDQDALSDLIRHLPESQGQASGRDLLAWMDLAGMLQRLHRELASDVLSFREVVEAVAAWGPQEQRRWAVLATLQERYHTKLDSLELWDRQTARSVALKQQECSFPGRIVLCGTVDMNRAMRLMLDQVADSVTALIFAPAEQADLFDSHGCVRPERWATFQIPLPLETVHLAEGPPQQADSIIAGLRREACRYGPDEISIGVPDESLVPLLKERLGQVGVQARWGPGKSVQETGVFCLLRAIGDYLRSRRFDDFAAWMRHPEMAHWLARQPDGPATSDWLTQLDESYNRHLPARLDLESASSMARLADLSGLLGPCRRLLEALWGSARPLVEWVAPWRTLLHQIYADKTFDLDRETDRLQWQACQALGDALEALGAVPPEISPVLHAADALSFALQACGTQRLGGTQEPDSVELLGWLELPLDDAPCLFVSSFNEGRVPSSFNADLFLPNSLRQQLGLEDNSRRYARDAYATCLLLNSRKHLEWFVGQTDRDGNPLSPSRLLFMDPNEPAARRLIRLMEPQHPLAQAGRGPRSGRPPAHSGPSARQNAPESASATPQRKLEFQDSTSPRCVDWEPPRPSPLEQPIEKMRVTDFRAYLACPYRFYLGRVLGLQGLDDRAAELDGRTFGQVLHEVVQCFGESPGRDSQDPEEIRAELLAHLDRVMSRDYGREPMASVWIQKEQMRLRLEAFAEHQARWRGEGWKILWTERDVRDACLTVDGQPMRLTGRIDRVDIHEETGRRVVLDYKTGDSARSPQQTHRHRDDWVDLQLPLYRHLIRSLDGEPSQLEFAEDAARTDPTAADVQLGYILLAKDPAHSGFSLADWDASLLAEADRQAEAIVRLVRSEVFWPPTAGPPGRPSEFAAICQEGVLIDA